MRSSAKPIALVLCLVIALGGCATMRYPKAFKVEGVEFGEFKEIDDDRALKLVALIYNFKTETWEDGTARSIALEEYLKLLFGRKSKYIKNSGVFGLKYDKAGLSTRTDDDLIKLYDILEPKADAYYIDSAPELTEIENTKRIVYLTALNSIARELKIRDGKRTTFSIVGQVLLTALSAALAML